MGCACGKEVLEINGKKYVVRSRLGEGGFSYVDLVEDLYTHKLLALKRVTLHGDDDVDNAKREVDYYKRINHPNVIKCVDDSMQDNVRQTSLGEILILLPYYGRGTLQDEIERRRATRKHFSERRVLGLFTHIAQGLLAMHNAKPEPLAHRDIKPGNVLLSDDFVPVLMDLGSAGPARIEVNSSSQAKWLQDFAAQNCSMMFRAPELFHVESHTVVDERIDVWSLGCLLYAICFFKSPFEAAHERGDSVALAVASGTVNFPESCQYSQHVVELVTSMLTVEVAQRPFLEVVLRQTESSSGSSRHQVETC